MTALPTHLGTTDKKVLLKYHKLLTGRNSAPPNSMTALQEVIDGGADVIEFDIRLTRDEQFVLLHDSTLERETTGTGLLNRLTLAEARLLRLRNSRERVASLTDVVGELKGLNRPLKVQVDLKVTEALSMATAVTLLDSLAPLLDNPQLHIVVGCLADWNLRTLQRLDRSDPQRVRRSPLHMGVDFMFHLDTPGEKVPSLPARVNAYGYLDDHPLGWRYQLPTAVYLQDRIETLLNLVPDAAEFYLRAEFVRHALRDGFDPVGFIKMERPAALVDLWTIDRSPDGSRDQEMRDLLATGPGQVTTNTALQWAAALK